jgi:hypothetical protein
MLKGSSVPDFTERHSDKIKGVTSCFDRIVLTGTIPGICYAEGMTRFLTFNNIRIFDYPQWALPLKEQIRQNAETIAAQNGLTIEFIRSKKDVRKEQRIQDIIAERGCHPGLVHILSAMEPCSSYKPWHDKKTHKTSLKYDSGKCLHYYFYFIDPELGLCYLRVPTWAPFRLQFYFNGHNKLAAQLFKKGIDAKMLDNCFMDIEDFDKAQKLANDLSARQIHKILDRYAHLYCPVVRNFEDGYHWSIMQAEYATDIVFKRQSDLAPIYDELIRTAVHAVKADNIATFLGRKLNGNYEDEMGNDFNTRIHGTRIKHHMGPVAIKMYDKHGLALRIETTVNDVTFFKHHRRVEHRDGTSEMMLAPLQKSIYSLNILAELMCAANRRYIDFISAIDDPGSATKDIEKIAKPVSDNGRSYRGFNLFDGDDLDLFEAVVRGEFNINGLSNRRIRKHLAGKTAHQISRMLKRLHTHGLIKKIGRTYKYYLTKFGRRIITTALKTRELFVIPSLRGILAH